MSATIKAMNAPVASLIVSSVQARKLISSGTGPALEVAQQCLEALCYCLRSALMYSRICVDWPWYCMPMHCSRMSNP